ncbi:MAG: hypothetical protein OXE92_01315 [Bacteroidetes bacterium]|nr:hypothetical protein [Bacteroidota bacterium]
MRLSSGKTLIFSIIFLSVIPNLYVQAQSFTPRLGFGLSIVGGTTDQAVGIGIDTRLAWIVNQDLSISTSANFINYIFKGRDEAAYFFHPQISAIVTLNAANVQSPYLIMGLGGNIPLGGTAESHDSGPSLHAGTGWVFSLQATSLYLEITPALIIVRSSVEVQLPLRFGVIL